MVTPASVRSARAFLYRREIPSNVISPRRFAVAAQELSKTFAELLRLIMALRSGGQGVGQAPIATRLAAKRG